MDRSSHYRESEPRGHGGRKMSEYVLSQSWQRIDVHEKFAGKDMSKLVATIDKLLEKYDRIQALLLVLRAQAKGAWISRGLAAMAGDKKPDPAEVLALVRE